MKTKIEKRIARTKKLTDLKARGDRIGLYMLRLDEVFPTKVVTPLTNAGLERVGDLRKKTDWDLLKYRDFGRKSLRIIAEFFSEYGLERPLPTPQQEETLEDRLAKFIFGKVHLVHGYGWGAARTAATLMIAAGLVTEESFQAILEAMQNPPPAKSSEEEEETRPSAWANQGQRTD